LIFMENDGAWDLFFATGLPEAYLAGLEPDSDEEETQNGPDPQ